MGPGALAEAVTRLPWVSPGAAALLALARSPTAASWEAVRADPGAVLLVVRHSPALRTLSGVCYFPALLSNPSLLEDVLRRLEASEPGWVDWTQSSVRPIYQAALQYAHAAHALAEREGTSDPNAAWVAGLLAPLGWLGVCAADTDAVAGCLADPAFARHPADVQERRWSMDAAALGRRLARRWRLPEWLSAVVAHLNLPVEIAARFGAEPELFRVVQKAISWIEERGEGLRLLGPGALSTQTLSDATDSKLSTEYSALSTSRPADVPLLPDLLRLAAQNLRLQGSLMLERVETDLDDLHAVLEEQRVAEAERLREQKLRALAEFAAGAGHEINNPLAVISGQAQYLLRKVGSGQWAVGSGETAGYDLADTRQNETNASGLPTAHCPLSTALQIIIAQAQRIHHILRDLMQFARPPRPSKQLVDLGVLVRETTTALEELARQRQVRLDCVAPEAPLHAEADPIQVRTALTCLVRNAIEAAPASPDAAGWASVRLTTSSESVDIIVEDNGPGPAALEREHLFDPFFSGRPAGRGRGLGLPTAWRLARQHGGDVRFTRPADGPTRFVLTLPCAAAPPALNSSPAAA